MRRRVVLTFLMIALFALPAFARRAWLTFPRNNMTLSSHIISATVEGMSVDSVALVINENRTHQTALRPDGNAEFVAIELPRGNVAIKLFASSGGIWRIQDSIMVTVPGFVDKIEMEITPDDLVADGRMLGRVNVKLFDKWGNFTSERYPVSLFIDGAELIGDDADPHSEGFQVYSVNGRASAQFRTKTQAGEYLLTAMVGQVRQTRKIQLKTYMRPMIAVGHIGGKLSYTEYNDMCDRVSDDRLPDEKFDVDGRGAFFLKGAVRDKFLLSMSYDSKVTRRPMFFRRTDPNELMPIYGDTGSLFYENHASTPIFIRMERDKSFVQWADYTTSLDDNSVYMRYTRTLTGINGEYYSQHIDAKLFASPTIKNEITRVTSHAQDIITPDGTSGFFYLSNSGIIRNSEQIRIETLDRYQSEVILHTEHLRRFADYTIDYERGEILFAQAILSHDGFRNPRVIVVDYEVSEGHSDAFIGGGRLVLKPSENIEFGLTGIIEEYENKSHNIYGGDITLRFLEEAFQIRGELAYSHYDDTLTEIDDQGGLAYIAEGQIQVDNLSSRLYYRHQEQNYRNLGISTTSRAGMKKMGGNLQYDLQGYDFRVDGFNETYDNNRERQRLQLGVRKDFDRLTPSTGIEMNRIDDGDTVKSYTILQNKLRWRLNTKFSLYGYHHQNFTKNNEYPNESALGAEYHLNGGHSIFGSVGHLNYNMRRLDRQFANIGLRSTVGSMKTRGVLQAESRRNDPFNSQAIFNVSDRFVIARWLALDLGFENERAVTGDAENDHTSVSASLTLKPGDLLITQKSEYSWHKSRGKKMLYTLAASTSDGRTFSLLGKGQFQVRSDVNKDLSNFDLRRARFLFGFAFRPIESDWLNLLAKIEYDMEHNEAFYPYHHNNTLLFSIQDVIAIGNRVELITRYAGKYNVQKMKMEFEGQIFELGGNYSYTDLLMTALRVEITDRLDIGLEGRVLYQRQAEDYLWDIAPEIGIVPMRNVRLGVGWNLLGYTHEQFSSNGYYAQGPYITVDMKLSERGLRLPVIDDPTLEDYYRRQNDTLFYPRTEPQTTIREYIPDDTPAVERRRFGYTDSLDVLPPDSLSDEAIEQNVGQEQDSTDLYYERDSSSTEPSFVDPGYLRRRDVQPPEGN